MLMPTALESSALNALGSFFGTSIGFGRGDSTVVVDAVRRIWEEEGCWAFYRGMGTKMTQTVFAAALMFAAKEEIAKSARRLLRKR